jgi:hypothetical protein
MLGFPGRDAYLADMKESYHICFTSHNEVMFRDEEDHGMFVNLMALRGYAEDTEILVDAEMSTHVHQNVFSARPMHYASNLRMSYTRYFNRKYDRKGRLGEKYTFLLKVVGTVHQMVLENYILRQGLHHAASATALGYPYCAVRELFAQDIGLQADLPVPMSRSYMATFLPRYAEFPDQYQMTEKGVFARSSFMEIRRAEQYYVSPRNYLYQMNRLTDDSWIQEQLKDNSGKPISLADIEHADERSVAQMLKNENGRNFSHTRMQDLDVCHLIDSDLLRGYGVSSVYQLTGSQRQQLARQLFYDYRLPEQQVRRCLVLA